jgi:hypothetical protein
VRRAARLRLVVGQKAERLGHVQWGRLVVGDFVHLAEDGEILKTLRVALGQDVVEISLTNYLTNFYQ